jgi:hypothetical protein
MANARIPQLGHTPGTEKIVKQEGDILGELWA